MRVWRWPILWAAAAIGAGASWVAPLRVSADTSGAARVTDATGQSILVAKEKNQAGIDSPQSSRDGLTVGWLVEYKDPDLGSRYAGALVIWRSGSVVRRWTAAQSFYSWTFWGNGEQVAFHDGPLHGEQSSHCELRDVKSGRLLALWNGDLEDASQRPAWAAGLDH